MKNLAIAVLAATMFCALPACKKEKNNTPSTTTPDPVIPRGIYAKINGIPWAATSTSYYSSVGGGISYIELSGYDSTGQSIELLINNFTTRGTYNVPQANDSAFYDVDFGFFGNKVAATSGIIAVQALTDSSVGGTFQFTAGSVTVTDGTFNINY